MRKFIQLKLKEEKGFSSLFFFMFLLTVLLTLFFGFAEYFRVNNVYQSVTTEIERAGNIAIEYSMNDEARGYHLSRIDTSVTQNLFEQYFTDRLTLSGDYEKIEDDNATLYQVHFDTFTVDEDTARITMKGTVEIPLEFMESYMPVPVSLPFDITTRNVNIED